MTAQTSTLAPAGISKEEADALVSEHTVIIRMESEEGYMLKSSPMPESEVRAYVEYHQGIGYFFDEEDCAVSCPCSRLRNPEWFVGK